MTPKTFWKEFSNLRSHLDRLGDLLILALRAQDMPRAREIGASYEKVSRELDELCGLEQPVTA